MNQKKNIAAAVIVVLIAIAGPWALIKYADLQASLLWTAIMGATAWAIRSNIEQKREYQKLLADRKREHYLQFLEFIAGLLEPKEDQPPIKGQAPKKNKTVSLEELRMWSLRLTLIGSDEVVNAWNKARNASTDPDNSLSAAKTWGKLWLAMRKDCGHIDTKLGVTDVLSSFVNDIEKNRTYLDS